MISAFVNQSRLQCSGGHCRSGTKTDLVNIFILLEVKTN